MANDSMLLLPWNQDKEYEILYILYHDECASSFTHSDD